MSIINSSGFGRPDYSAPIPVLNGPQESWNLTIPANGTEQAGTIDCEAFDYVSVWLYYNPNPQRISFAWSTQLPAPGTGTYTDYIGLPDNNVGGVLHLPTRMRYLTISVTDLSGAQNYSQGYFWGTNRPGNSPGALNIGQNDYGFTYTNIAPGTQTNEFPNFMPGGAVVAAVMGGEYYLTIDYYSAFNGWLSLWDSGDFAAGVPTTQTVALPVAPVRVNMQNRASVASSGHVSIVNFAPIYG